MSKTFENSCFKGCLIYLVVLGALVVLGTVGLGSLGVRLGIGAKQATTGVTALTTSQQPGPEAQAQGQSQQSAPAAGTPQPITVQVGTGVGAQTGGASLPLVQATVVVTIPQPQINIPQLQPGAGVTPAPQAQAQAQGVSGQATTPFYIVQGGDTLWSIATRFGTTVDALKSANHLSDTLIKPNQLLYLSPPQQQTQPQSVAPMSPSIGSVDPATGALPSMPDTGINAHR